MSRFPELAASAAALTLLLAAPVSADPLGLGRAATPDEIAAWNIDVRPDGTGLPEGHGTVDEGEGIFSDKCATCHGDFGEGVGRWPVLTGGFGSLKSARPVKTTGSYWPYLSTVFDYIHRAMPFGDAQSLQPDEVYAITAYLLYMNDLVDEDFELSRENFTSIKLPNEANFIMDDRAETEIPVFSKDVCMSDCKDKVEITARAEVLDVTPDEEPANAGNQTSEAGAAAEPSPEPEAPAADPALIAAGEKVFRKCKSCHQIGEGAKNRVGPELNGLLGRAPGMAQGFRYSKAMQAYGEDGTHWTDESLAAFLADPRGVVKGTKMSFRGLPDKGDVAALIAYIKSTSQ